MNDSLNKCMSPRLQMHTDGINVLKTDEPMSRIIDSVGCIPLEVNYDPMFFALVNSIIGQQLSKGAATAIRKRFCAIYPHTQFPTSLDVLNTPKQDLRNIGLSNSKTIYIQELAQRDSEGLLPSAEDCASLDDCEVIELLTQSKGIGPWSAQMVLIFNLSRPDIFPKTDRGILRAFGLLYLDGVIPTPDEASEYAEHWKPYRSLASRYLWQALDNKII